MTEVDWTPVQMYFGIGKKAAYIAELTNHEGQPLFRAKSEELNVTIRITSREYSMIMSNPNLHYFTTALKVHLRAKRAIFEGLGLNWPESGAAPLEVRASEEFLLSKQIEFIDIPGEEE